jgi:hypothetical protein
MPSALDRLTTDASKFVDATLLGQEATYTAAGQSAGTSIYCLFVNADSINDPLGIETGSTGPAALVRTTDAPSARSGDKLVAGGTTWRVMDARPDGHGHTLLTLTADSSLQPPPPPHTLATVYAGGSPTVPLTWILVGSGHSAVHVFRRMSGTTAWTRIATLSGSAASHIDSAPGENIYEYQVRAVNAAGIGAPSNTIAVEVSI